MTDLNRKMVEVTINIEGNMKGLMNVLSQYGIELVDFGNRTWIGFTGNDVIAVGQTPSQCRKGIATMAVRKDIFKAMEKDLSII